MSNRFRRRYEVPAGELPRLMNEIVDQSGPDEARAVERLLGLLTSLSMSAEDTLTFVAPRGTSEIVERALGVMARSDRHQARALRTRNRA